MKVSKEELRNQVFSIVTKLEISEKDAETITDVLVKADLRGVDTHGSKLLPIYLQRVENGTINLDADVKVKEMGVITQIDGDHGFGQLIGVKAMNLAIEKAKEHGIGIVGAKNTNHYGMAAYYSLQATNEEMLGYTCCNSYPWVTPWGGRERKFGTNPFSYGIPAKERRPIVVDMATSSVPVRKVKDLEEKGKDLPEKVGIDNEGNLTVNATKILDNGAILPFGTYKGYGINLLVDVLSGIFTGSDSGEDVKSLYQLDDKMTLGQFYMAIEPRIIGKENFKERVDKLIDSVKKTKPMKSADEVYLPGELEFLEEERRKKEGIPVKDNLWKDLEDWKKKLSS